MDIPTLLLSLKEDVSCSVCTQLYKDPKQLPCLHIFCLECLNDVAKSQLKTSVCHGKIKCPLCHIEFAVPKNRTIETLPSCFYVKNLLDILSIKECSTLNVTCGNCEIKCEEASYCLQCGGFWCKVCRNVHNLLRAYRDHRVLALKDFLEKDYEVVLKRPAFCLKKLHEKEVLDFYCKMCEMPVCQNCVTIEHHQHDVEYLEVTTRAAKFSMMAQLETAENKRQTLSECLRELEKKSCEIEERCQFIKRQIQDAVKSLILKLQQQEQELTTEVEQEAKIEQDRVTKDKAKLSSHLKQIEDAMSRAKRFIDFSTSADLVRAKDFVNKLFQEPRTPEFTFSCKGEGSDTHTVFLENKAISKSLKTGIGCLGKTTTRASRCTLEGFSEATGLETRFKLITRNADGNQSYCPGDHITVEYASYKDGIIAGEMKIVDRKNGSYEVSCIPKCDGDHYVSARVNGEEIGGCPVIRVRKRSYKLQRRVDGVRTVEVGSPESSPPHAVWPTSVPSGFPRALPLAAEKLEKTGDKPVAVVINGPWGVTVNDKNEIMVCEFWNNRLQVFDENGDFVTINEHKLLSGPTGICTDSDGRIYVTVKKRYYCLNQMDSMLKRSLTGINKM